MLAAPLASGGLRPLRWLGDEDSPPRYAPGFSRPSLCPAGCGEDRQGPELPPDQGPRQEAPGGGRVGEYLCPGGWGEPEGMGGVVPHRVDRGREEGEALIQMFPSAPRDNHKEEGTF